MRCGLVREIAADDQLMCVVHWARSCFVPCRRADFFVLSETVYGVLPVIQYPIAVMRAPFHMHPF